ncbi:MAG: GNAT family N-acetyltransferase [Betaproteobacteria bacterium]|nr:GNAT family N-acetyltransferase [Betaproteobacteria bacterium]MBA3777473.1 GNAT family N-acetyltransferase [Betaproteobacteria bacterium]
MPKISLAIVDPRTAAVAALIAELDAYQSDLYPAASNHLLPVAALRAPNVRVIGATFDGTLAGCGAVVDQGAYAEIKRMFVAAPFRRFGVACSILAELETIANKSGLRIARLESGIHQTEALRFYERAGYVRRAEFGSYTPDPLSVFMEKAIA